MSDEHKALARRVFEEVWNHLDATVVDRIYAEDYVAHIASAPEDISGVERFKQFVALFRALSPDLRFAVEDQIAEGDRVATRWTARGTRTAGLGSITSTDQPVVVTGISIHRIANGKLVESWDNWDAVTALQALGPDVLESVGLSF